MMKRLKALLSDKEKRMRLIFALGIAGIAFIVIPDLMPKNSAAEKHRTEPKDSIGETEEYRLSLEKRLSDMISGIEGAGETRVMISISSAKEYVYAEKSDTDRQSRSEGETVRSRDEPILSGQNPVIRTILVPKIGGAAIICEGAGDSIIRERVLSTASVVLGIPSSRISVQPLGTGNGDNSYH